jgi:hypothetical protein
VQSQSSSTDHRNGVSFDQQDGIALDGRTGHDAIGAYAGVSRRVAKSAESNPELDLHPLLASSLEMSGTAASPAQHAMVGRFTQFGRAACRLAIYFLFVSKVISGYSGEGPFSKGDFLPSRYSPKKAST